jgi:outer membrane protein assembly factor BamE
MVRLLSVALVLFLSSCVYTLGIQQGNILDQKDIDKLRVDLTKNQVVFVLGNPVVDDSFTDNEWIYLYTFSKRSSAEDTTKRLKLIFNEEKLVAAEGDYEIPEELKLSESN